MSRPKPPRPVKLIVSILTAERDLAEQVRERLVDCYGPLDYCSEELPFDFTDYYAGEIGRDLFRLLLSFEELISPGRLPAIKLCANDLEDAFVRGDGTRRVNIDPGYIALQHLILATCKPFAHRPYLGEGIYADMTLIFRGGTFRPLEWTFPDYGSDLMIGILNRIRSTYFQQVRT